MLILEIFRKPRQGYRVVSSRKKHGAFISQMITLPYFYASAVAVIGMSAFAYSLFLKIRMFKNAIYKVSSIVQRSPVYEISMVPEHKPISYTSGQFIFVRFFNEKLSRESHPFSIASKSNAPQLTILVKQLGDFTSKLEHLQVGDKVAIEGPYGKFNYQAAQSRNQVWIAGGIGIVPFLGMTQDLEDGLMPSYTVHLYYSVSDDADFIGLNMLNTLAATANNFRFIPWNSKRQGRLDAAAIYQLSGRFKDRDFFLCGPPPFKDSIVTSLLKQGVPNSRIHEEVFDFR
ncbi:hypothetical protein HZB02_07630 [Candidatus Woesearchaeota archaeon]|nr:hypothetical protein [Candidatus Woesearchaeota archaeon]